MIVGGKDARHQKRCSAIQHCRLDRTKVKLKIKDFK